MNIFKSFTNETNTSVLLMVRALFSSQPGHRKFWPNLV